LIKKNKKIKINNNNKLIIKSQIKNCKVTLINNKINNKIN